MLRAFVPRPPTLRGCAAFVAISLAAAPAQAHGFGERFVLPLPLWLWLVGAGLTIVLTFVAMTVLVRERRIDGHYPRLDLDEATPSPLTAAVGTALFVLVVVAGFVGAQDPYANILTTFVWVIWWVGFAFACALVGNLWALVNPFSTTFRWAERAWIAFTNSPLSLARPYPARLGAWPAAALFLVFAWAELIWSGNDVPRNLAAALTVYALITWAGMFVWGRETWLTNGEAFTIAFGILARFAPLAVEQMDGAPRLVLRPYGAGLLADDRLRVPMAAFVLLMLSTVTFDGFIETPTFQQITNALYGSRTIANMLFQLSDAGINDFAFVKTVTLLAFPLLFVAAYWLTSALMAFLPRRYAAARLVPIGTVACAFVLTLVPIAVAYHLSHYFSLLATSGQFIIPLLSDPFGWGWNLLGTRGYDVDIGIVSPYVLWYGATTVIVIGHVIAVYLAHVVAMRVFGSSRAATISQIPMVVLMVIYTMSSLWILAQPVVG